MLLDNQEVKDSQQDMEKQQGALDREQRELDARLAQLAEGSLALLELIFPRHVIEFMSDSHQATQKLLSPGTDLSALACRHEQVGGQARGKGRWGVGTRREQVGGRHEA